MASFGFDFFVPLSYNFHDTPWDQSLAVILHDWDVDAIESANWVRRVTIKSTSRHVLSDSCSSACYQRE